MDKKVINPLNSIKTGMGLSFHRYNIKECNVIRKDAVEPEKQIEVPAFFNVHVEEVLACVNSCISTATTVNCNGLFKDAA